MIYTVERANLISKQLRKFTDSYAHMVAGQFANIDFWIDEVINSVRAIDEHSMRFEKMCEAQIKWIEEKEQKKLHMMFQAAIAKGVEAEGADDRGVQLLQEMSDTLEQQEQVEDVEDAEEMPPEAADLQGTEGTPPEEEEQAEPAPPQEQGAGLMSRGGM